MTKKAKKVIGIVMLSVSILIISIGIFAMPDIIRSLVSTQSSNTQLLAFFIGQLAANIIFLAIGVTIALLAVRMLKS